MYLIIVGLGRIGRSFVDIATRNRQNVVIIDRDERRCREIAENYDAMTIVGDSTSEEILKEAGIEKADALVATTNDDAINLMTALLAKELGVATIISVVNKYEHVEMFKRAGVTVQKNPNFLIAQHLYKSVRHPNIMDFMPLKDAEILKVSIPSYSRHNGITISSLSMPRDTIIISIERGDELIIPRGDTKVLEGDILTIFAKSKSIKKVEGLFDR